MAIAPPLDGPVGIHDEPIRVDLEVRAETGAGGAGAVGRIEGEEPGRDLGQRSAAVRARVVRGEDLLGAVRHRDDDDPARHARRRLDRVRQPLAVLLVAGRLGHQPIDHDFDRVLLLLVELGRVVQVHERPVDPGAQEALLDHLGHLLLVFALLARNVGGQDREACAGLKTEGSVHHFLDRLGLDRPAALGAVGLADRGVEEPQVVVDLGDRADG